MPPRTFDWRDDPTGTVIAVLANMDPPAASRVANFIAIRLSAPAAATVTP
jgi:flagellar motility protein MotE (MotC chaperone)